VISTKHEWSPDQVEEVPEVQTKGGPTTIPSHPKSKASIPAERPQTTPDEPIRNLAVRIRLSIDSRLDELLHELRRAGVRSSKTEIVEMLVWELPANPKGEFRKRLSAFREKAPRETPV
jgi:hypothetical protein